MEVQLVSSGLAILSVMGRTTPLGRDVPSMTYSHNAFMITLTFDTRMFKMKKENDTHMYSIYVYTYILDSILPNNGQRINSYKAVMPLQVHGRLILH